VVQHVTETEAVKEIEGQARQEARVAAPRPRPKSRADTDADADGDDAGGGGRGRRKAVIAKLVILKKPGRKGRAFWLSQ